MRWGGAIGPDSPHFVQPDPRFCAPAEHWDQSARDRFAYDLADRFRAGELTQRQLRNRLDAFVHSTTDRWPEQDPTLK